MPPGKHRLISLTLVLLGSAACPAANNSETAYTDPKNADADFGIQGEYIGEFVSPKGAKSRGPGDRVGRG